MLKLTRKGVDETWIMWVTLIKPILIRLMGTRAAEMFGVGDFWLENFVLSLMSKHLWWIFIEIKQKKGPKWPTQKKTFFFKITNSQFFFSKISEIGPWVSRIQFCKGYWCGSTNIGDKILISNLVSSQKPSTKHFSRQYIHSQYKYQPPQLSNIQL